MDSTIAKVLGNGVLTDLLDRKSRQLVLVQLELSEVCREVDHSIGVEQPQRGVEQIDMACLHIPIIIQPFTVGVSRRVDDDDVVFSFSTFDGFVDEFNAVLCDILMPVSYTHLTLPTICSV